MASYFCPSVYSKLISTSYESPFFTKPCNKTSYNFSLARARARVCVNYLQIRFIYRHPVRVAHVKCAIRIVATPAAQAMSVASLRHPHTANQELGQPSPCRGRR